jgi:DNA repair protein RecN (Recombination protein N)
MLSSLHIENFALIDKLDLEFGDGLNILTGSTGAGKSIIIGALDLILGGRGSEEIVRTGETACIVEGNFTIGDKNLKGYLKEKFDLKPVDNSFVIRREYKRKGGGRAFIDGSQVSLSDLKDLSEYLGDILGQHSHQALLNPATHSGYLDKFAGLDEKVAELRVVYNITITLRDDLASADRIAREISDRIDLLNFQIGEIHKAALQPGEEEKLKADKKFLENARKIRESADLASSLILEDDGSAVERIGEAEKNLATLAPISDKIKDLIPSLHASSETLKDIVIELKNLVSHIDDDPQRLEQVNERLDEIYRLKKKYGADIDEILKFSEKSERELINLKTKQHDSQNLQARFSEALTDLNSLAAAVSRSRKKSAPELENLVIGKLTQMGIPKAQFAISIGVSEISNGLYYQNGIHLSGDSNGFDIVEFQFCANPGEGLKPLAKIASGGEISRVMLALKNAFLRGKGDTFEVFDEIDVGISGDVASKVARQLKELSKKHQVICITHLAQIAAMADHHYRVHKGTTQGRSVTRVGRLEYDERVAEIAGLLSGEKISPKAIAGAEELLMNSRKLE